MFMTINNYDKNMKISIYAFFIKFSLFLRNTVI